MIRNTVAAVALGVFTVAVGGHPALAQDKKVVIGMPGIPPIFTTVQPLTAEKVGLFKKHGANVELRPFDNGTAAARAVIAGDIDMSMSPSPPVIDRISNSVGGGTMFASPTPTGCSPRSIRRRPSAATWSARAARARWRTLAARRRLPGGEDRPGRRSRSAPTRRPPCWRAATFGVLHLDDLALIKSQGKKLHVLEMKKTNPDSHYLALVVRADKLKDNRDAYVRTVAALVALHEGPRRTPIQRPARPATQRMSRRPRSRSSWRSTSGPATPTASTAASSRRPSR